jgi:hypothetical protein
MRAAMSYPINYSSNCPRDCRQLNRCSQQANVDNAVIIIGHVGDGQNREIHIITVQVLKDICVSSECIGNSDSDMFGRFLTDSFNVGRILSIRPSPCGS